jgi:hypothetical protein
LGKLEGTAHQRPGALRVLDFAGDFVEVGLPVVFVEVRFWIEQIHLTWTTVHKEVDDRLGLRLKMRLAWFEIG